MIELKAADGHKFSAYRADPPEAPKGAVVVLQETSKDYPHIRKVADGFAEYGYVIIAPTLYERAEKAGQNAKKLEEADFVMRVGTEGPLADIQAAVDSVKDAGKVAVVGYSGGGYLAYLSANRVRGLACAIGYYGPGIQDEFREKRKIPTLLHFAENDPLIPSEEVIQFRANRPDVSVYTYAAGHGFSCGEAGSYDNDAASKALERTLFWISQYVVGQPPVTLKNAGAYALQKTDKKKKKKAGADDGPPMD